ncbi:Aste57867_9027 [Aphanomyces stellatus]|uniref:peptidylprolyl isomerase n=1 Tax=Aphanomyces stellatus TaxID=120398 RepID=A0A485KLR1_9STRA|nr:hypothetical protein As57867_008991 [Aphanomyces stellatus]VFT85911.1 Aste57867_9027 [Aphanomyces stellatus]
MSERMAAAKDESFVAVKVQLAARWKDMGNASFKAKEFRRAMAHYEQGLRLLEVPPSCTYSPDELASVGPVAATLHVNIAACLLNGATFQNRACVDHCTKAIQYDPLNVKARYRRSQAYMKDKEFTLAKQDLADALRMDPSNGTLRACIVILVVNTL